MIKRTKLAKRESSDMPEGSLMQLADSKNLRISAWTLVVAIQAVESELRKLRAGSKDEMEAEDYECLEHYELAAEELEKAYAEAARSVINLPLYSQLVQR